MFNKKQVNAIIKVLKDDAIDGRSALQRVFEQGGYAWATNGYVALELGKVKDDFKGKCVPLERLVGWSEWNLPKDEREKLWALTDDMTLPYTDRGEDYHVRTDKNYSEFTEKIGKAGEEYTYLFTTDYSGVYGWEVCETPCFKPLTEMED